MKQPPKIESVSIAKQELLQLEAENKFIFHGTDAETDVIHPRQAVDSTRGPVGDPAIYGSAIAETAIFYAIMKARNFSNGSVTSCESSHVNPDTGEVTSEYRISKEDFKQLNNDASGYVYIFNKSEFAPAGKMSPEHSRDKAIQPIKRIAVTKADLPKNITLT